MLEQVETLQSALSGVREQLSVIHDATARLTAMVNAIELVREHSDDEKNVELALPEMTERARELLGEIFSGIELAQKQATI